MSLLRRLSKRNSIKPLTSSTRPRPQSQGPGVPSNTTGGKASGDGAEQGCLEIVVSDSGAGISPENQKKLFKEVVQFNPEKLQGGGGSGFGLFITKGIVDLHGGEISVYSAGEGKGTSFTLRLPMAREKPQISQAASDQRGEEQIRQPAEATTAAVAVVNAGDSVSARAGGLRQVSQVPLQAQVATRSLQQISFTGGPSIDLANVGTGYSMLRSLLGEAVQSVGAQSHRGSCHESPESHSRRHCSSKGRSHGI
jgi:Histidine kinase-, DNA gyrase B-, and HSP90-like ATPase